MIVFISLFIVGGCSLFQNGNEAELEKTTVKEGYYHQLEEVTNELFLSEKDAQEWMKYYLKDNQDKEVNKTRNYSIKRRYAGDIRNSIITE
ncbi:hypothetical protein [Oceanobacillus jeddahense]|uniref:Uncharacterized protein n=1 Tax=Oceanobacillus jeddahense TaxID=1462527 RepID=A0ABY5JLB3_9BACI|nr:hypothetical protein [Oceanobacillus jeddahense]UUI01100.1 hypothetical protein NP439_13615 [Oceanobacillus jeddahense]